MWEPLWCITWWWMAHRERSCNRERSHEKTGSQSMGRGWKHQALPKHCLKVPPQLLLSLSKGMLLITSFWPSPLKGFTLLLSLHWDQFPQHTNLWGTNHIQTKALPNYFHSVILKWAVLGNLQQNLPTLLGFTTRRGQGHLVNRVQWCCSTLYNAEDIPSQPRIRGLKCQ